MKKAVILGAGISGLSIGSKLSKKFKIHLLEKNSFIGGLCASFKYKDSILDIGPHKLYSPFPHIMEEFSSILGEEYIKVKKRNSLRLLGKYFEFPIKITQMIKNISPKFIIIGIWIGFGYGLALIGSVFGKKENTTYEDYFINGFGKKGYTVLFKDLAWKVWGNPKLLTEELARKRVPIPNISSLIKSVFSKSEKQEVSAEYFYYPKKGIGIVCDNLAISIKKNQGTIELNSSPTSIKIENNHASSIAYSNKEKNIISQTDLLISTIPVNELVFLLNPMPPKEILDAANSLKYKGMILVYIIIDKPKIMDDIWTFFPDKEVLFNRVSEQKNFSPFTVPEDKTILMIDMTSALEDKLWKLPDKEIISLVLNDLKKVKILKNEKIIECFVKKIGNVYPILSVNYKENLTKILDYIDQIPNIYTIGRYGMFNYNNIDHCIDMANVISEHIISHKTKSEWRQKRKYFDSYRIVD